MLRSRAKRALRLRSPRDTPLALPTNVLLLRWDTKSDKRIKRTFLRHGPTRRTSFMPMCVRVVKQGRLATGASTRDWLLIQSSKTGAIQPASVRSLCTAPGDVDIEDSVMEPCTVSASFVALK